MGDERAWPDWRIHVWTTLTEDVPAAFPGGPSHKAGTGVYVASVARDRAGLTTGFVAASPAALALSAAHTAAQAGERLRPSIAYQPVTASPFGAGFDVTYETTPMLHDFFEFGFVAVTLSFLALEAFSNWIIADDLTAAIELRRGRQTVRWNADEAQRHATLDEKVRQILPRLRDSPAPPRALLERLDGLKRVRHDTVHLKGRDAHPRGPQLATSYFHRLLALDIRSFPRCSVDVMLHFLPETARPQWLVAADELTRIQSSSA
jgi:hypothetical protein